MQMLAAGGLKGWAAGTWRPPALMEQTSKLMAGWYLARTDRREQAIPLLEEAARSANRTPINGYAEEKLASLVEGERMRVREEDGERTSAPPVVVERE